MADKPYGKFNLEQLKQLTDLLHESRNLSSTLENVFRATNPQRLKDILGDDFSWVHFYEMPFNVSNGFENFPVKIVEKFRVGV